MGRAHLRVRSITGPRFSPTQEFKKKPHSIKIAASGDFNGNSHADLLLHNRNTGQWFYRYMNGPTLVGTSAVFSQPNYMFPVLVGPR
ncbi:MAG TPA: hypothetical protein VEU33_30415 [Archangium sp.]|nr:hypothetical protein [Archangium sp.]